MLAKVNVRRPVVSILATHGWLDATNASILELHSQSPSGLTAYPNPTEGKISVVTTEVPTAVQVFDLQGRLMDAPTSPDLTTTIDLSDVPNGCYVVHVQLAKSIKTTRVIKLNTGAIR